MGICKFLSVGIGFDSLITAMPASTTSIVGMHGTLYSPPPFMTDLDKQCAVSVSQKKPFALAALLMYPSPSPFIWPVIAAPGRGKDSFWVPFLNISRRNRDIQ